MKKISKNIIAVLMICMLFECIFMVKEGKAVGNSYWLTGVYEDSKLVYQGNKIVVTKKWAKTSLKEGPTYDKRKNMKKTIKISSKCIIESGDDEMIRLPYKKYLKRFGIKKGDNMTSVSMELKIVNGKVVKIGFYA